MSEETKLEIEFPQAFAVKAMGANDPSFVEHVRALVLAHSEEKQPIRISHRESKNGKFLSVTVEITAVSKQQLDAIYQDLTDDERIVMAL